MAGRPPIGTDAQGAREYLGCSQAMFDELRRTKAVLPVRRGWYVYSDLDAAVTRLVAERGNVVTPGHEDDTERIPCAAPPGNVGRKRARLVYRKTEDLLREVR